MNQVESHPYFTNTALFDFCKAKGIALVAYSPLGSPNRPWAAQDTAKPLLEDGYLQELGRKYDKNAGQIALKWQIQRGVCVIPKSTNPKRIEQNFDIFDFDLNEEEMKKIENLDTNVRYMKLALRNIDDTIPKHHPFKDVFDS